jgi:hypothetical protein
MKRFVIRAPNWRMLLIGVGGLLLACTIAAETAVSYLAAAGVAALVVRGEWIRRRKTSGRA